MTTIEARAPANPQHMVALERANEVRLARAELKRRIRGGELTVGEIIHECPSEAQRMPVAELLMTQRGLGAVSVRKLLRATMIRESKPLGALTERQRALLQAGLEEHTALGPYSRIARRAPAPSEASAGIGRGEKARALRHRGSDRRHEASTSARACSH